MAVRHLLLTLPSLSLLLGCVTSPPPALDVANNLVAFDKPIPLVRPDCGSEGDEGDEGPAHRTGESPDLALLAAADDDDLTLLQPVLEPLVAGRYTERRVRAWGSWEMATMNVELAQYHLHYVQRSLEGLDREQERALGRLAIGREAMLELDLHQRHRQRLLQDLREAEARRANCQERLSKWDKQVAALDQLADAHPRDRHFLPRRGP